MNEPFSSEGLLSLNSRISTYGEDPKLILIRGLPGTGKSTLAMALKEKGYVHIEADFEPDPVTWTPRSTKSVIHGRLVRSLATNRNRPAVGNAAPLIAMASAALV